jgi:hypothetical protein
MILKDGKFWDDKGNVVPIEHGNKEQIALMIEAMMPRPKQIEEPSLSALKKACKEYIDSLADGEYDREDEHYIYEAAMEAMYGKEVWEYINSKLK